MIIDKDGFKLKCFIEGQGKPIFIIGDASYYQRVFSPKLRENFQLVFVDHKGFGTPPNYDVPNSEFELDKIINDIEYVRQFLKLNDFIIVGHSGHAFMALEYAKKYPQYVTHVVMLGITPKLGDEYKKACDEYWKNFASPERKEKQRANEELLPDKKLALLPADQCFIQTYIRNAPKIWFDYKFDSTPFWDESKLNVQMFNYVWGDVFAKIDITNGLENFDIPVFLGVGKYDFIAPPSMWTETILGKFKNLTHILFENSGHTPQYEEAELFQKLMLTWLSK